MLRVTTRRVPAQSSTTALAIGRAIVGHHAHEELLRGERATRTVVAASEATNSRLLTKDRRA